MNLEYATKIKGWMSINELKWLAIHAQQSPVIVEVGCFHGRSTRALVDNCSGMVYAVDTWPNQYIKDDGKPLMEIGDPVLQAFIRNISEPQSQALLVILRKTLSQAIPDIMSRVDMVFLDGDHRYENVLEDISAAERIIKPGGLICGHDFTHEDWPGVRKAVMERYPNVLLGPDSIWFTYV